MDTVNRHNIKLVALLFVGGAILFSSCKGGGGLAKADAESAITLRVDSMVQVDWENGQRKLMLKAPLIEHYGLAKEPYVEFQKGVSFTSYEDSTQEVASTLVADYAINYEKQKLWEARGNVVITNSDGRILETEQLFWNQKLEKIYSNVESKITDGDNVIIGVGFEADQEFTEYTLRSPKGQLLMDAEPTKATEATINVDTMSRNE